jgi:hypothetical protein
LGTKSNGQTRKARKKCDINWPIVSAKKGRTILDDVKVRAKYTYQPISSQGINPCWKISIPIKTKTFPIARTTKGWSLNEETSIHGPGLRLGSLLVTVIVAITQHVRQIKPVMGTPQAKPTLEKRWCSMMGKTTLPTCFGPGNQILLRSRKGNAHTPEPDDATPIASALMPVKWVEILPNRG